MTNKEVYDRLVEHNNYHYNLSKAAEELSELTTILLQKINKPVRVDDKDIIDELGDVKIRIEILERLFGEDKVKARVQYKLDKYSRYILKDKYKNV